jgi:hypothetical protein
MRTLSCRTRRAEVRGIALLLLTLVGCGRTKAPTTSLTGAAETKPGEAASTIRFRSMAEEAGLQYSWSAPGKHPLTILQTIGNGCAFLDYDGDGNLDILLVGPKPGLFRGDGAGTFTDVSASVLGNLSGYFLGCAVGDFDNDGFVDVYLSGYREGRLLHNEGGKKFTDVTKQAGLPPQAWGTSATWTDLDDDGFLDLYIANYVDFSPQSKPQLCYFPTNDKSKKILSSCGPKYYQPIKGKLYQNKRGKFMDVTQAWGAHKHAGKGLGVAAVDFDGSGHESIAVANDETDGNLFLGEGGGKLRDIGVEANVARDRDGSIHAGMGIDWGDYNNDGKLDLVVTTFRSEAKSLYRNDGERFFSDVSFESGLGRIAMPYVSFGCKFLDADNDGWLDVLIASGHVQDNIEELEDTTYRQPLVLLRNNKGLFDDVSPSSGVEAVGKLVGRGLAVGDFDNDGRLDALIVDSEGKVVLLHNETPQAGHWLLLKLTGKLTHGALINVTLPEGKKLLRHCQTDGSYMSASDSRVHLGLGSATKATVTVKWPSGKTTEHKDLAADRIHTLKE